MTPGQVLKTSVIFPICDFCVRRSIMLPVFMPSSTSAADPYAGIKRVPEGSTVSRKLLIMVPAPPSTLPTCDMAEWTIKISPAPNPAAARSDFKSASDDASIRALRRFRTIDRKELYNGRMDLRIDRGMSLVI